MNNFETDNNSEIIFSLKEKIEFFSSLYFLYKSGMPILDCFKSVADSASSQNVRNLCYQVSRRIEKNGNSLRQAILPHSQKLGKAYTMLLIAGEESGKLEITLSSIDKNLSKEEDIINGIKVSLAYPVFMLLLTIGVFCLSKFFLIKMFSSMDEMFSSSEIIALAISTAIKTACVYLLIGGIVFYIWKNKVLQIKIAEFFSKIPLIAGILKDYYYKNFFSVFSLAYNAGIPINEALNLSISVIGMPSITQKLKKSEIMMTKGCKLVQALAISSAFTRNVLSQVSAGEEAGSLDSVFKNISQRFEKDLDMKIKTAIKLLEPAMMIFIGIIIGYVVVTAYNTYYQNLMSIF